MVFRRSHNSVGVSLVADGIAVKGPRDIDRRQVPSGRSTIAKQAGGERDMIVEKLVMGASQLAVGK